MSVITAQTLSEVDSLIADNPKVVVDFGAESWCVPCRRLAPHYEAVSGKAEDVVFVKVDIDEVEGAKEAYDIMSVPTVLAFKSGEFVNALSGRTAVALSAELAQVLS